jgi:hypothetical protein
MELENIKTEEKKVLTINLIDRMLETDKINSWEREFLESIKQQLNYRDDLSEKQRNTLEKIKKKAEK